MKTLTETLIEEEVQGSSKLEQVNYKFGRHLLEDEVELDHFTYSPFVLYSLPNDIPFEGGMVLRKNSTKNTAFFTQDLGEGAKLEYSYHDNAFGRCDISFKESQNKVLVFKGY
ncbi:MAG: hypothetical protein KKA65_02565 [Nanoarchaeota archaeon]|nr:hypothetical protein [Nanoarchaeota archaeon]MBU4352744.1 hypothetical protein [Nanoarchaeota archaeon]MBU4456360.1 hypothetical protein [Nanoarchaeota archaeon]MCG2719273.1 hypothetical protein [Nanoarchaeota archaeon]